MERKIVSKSGKLSMCSMFWVETLLAVVTSILGVVTGLWAPWIEAVFGIDPDRHSGSTEWNVVIACALSAIIFAALARRNWHKRLWA